MSERVKGAMDTIQRVMGMIRPEIIQQLRLRRQELPDSNEGKSKRTSSVRMRKAMRSRLSPRHRKA